MAAFDTPWLDSMSSPARVLGPGSPSSSQDQSFTTTASFSPTKLGFMNQRKTVVVQKKSPLLIATPPQITRALAFSHPFLLPLNKLVGLISWSSGDPWESFLIVALFWALVLYGDAAIRWAGPVIAVAVLIFGMYSRRYSPLSSTGTAGDQAKGHRKADSDVTIKHQKSLDEILDTLTVLTSRCNILLDPFIELTDFLSTQRTATSATTRPALTTLFFRIILITPVWFCLALPPIRLITSQRVVLLVGTLALSWHSRPARVTRTLLWRSLSVRYCASMVTGFRFMDSRPNNDTPPPLPPRARSQQDIASSLASTGPSTSAGVRFTYVVYENQRRWLGLGWTSSLFAYERAPWTDEELSPSQPKEAFQLPTVDNGDSKWQWVPGSEWQHEGAGKSSSASSNGSISEGWIYYDNKWNDGRRQDGWGRYTRRRKWYRDAELVEIPRATADNTAELPATEAKSTSDVLFDRSNPNKNENDSNNGQVKRRHFFRRNSKTSAHGSNHSNKTLFASDEEQDHRAVPEATERESDWNMGDEVKMGLG